MAWLTGFQGSAGSAVVLPEEAAIFVAGRYTLQVREQVDAKHWQYVGVPQSRVAEWRRAHPSGGARLGYDRWLNTTRSVNPAAQSLEGQGTRLTAVYPHPLEESRT